MPHFSRSQARPFCKGKSGVTAVLALSLAVPACIAGPLASLSGGEVGRIEFDSITPPDRWQFVRKNMDNTKSVTVHGDLLMPRTWGDPRVPAVIISHDSGGVTPKLYDVWARSLNDAGIAVFIIDSFKPRGIDSTTHHQDQVATAETPNSLRVINTIAKSVHKLGPLYITSGVLTVYFILDI